MMDLLERSKQIGGSDISVIMGLNPWKTPLRLYAEKVGEIEPDDLSEKEHVELGTELEDFVSKKFERRYKKDTGQEIRVRRDRRTFRHPVYDYMVAHIDRRIVGSEAILEAKTCSAYKIDDWKEEEIPVPYVMQCVWYMGIVGMTKAYIACLIGGQKFVWKEIEFDQELFDTMVEQARIFWEEHVLKYVPPVAVGADNASIIELFPKDSTPELIQATEEVNSTIALLQETKAHLKTLMDQKNDMEARIKQIIGDNTGLITEEFKATWKNQAGSPRYFKEKMKEDGIYDKYTEETIIRVLRISPLKKDGKK